MSARARLGGLAAILVAAWAWTAGPASAQEAAGDTLAAPPAGGIVEPDRPYGLGVGIGKLSWESGVPYEDVTLTVLSLERDLWTGVRGRAEMAGGTSSLTTPDGPPSDAWVLSFDLRLTLAPDFGPFHRLGVLPYVLGGVSSLITNPTGANADDLPTRSQSAWSWGGGVRARLPARLEAAVEASSMMVRFADPVVPENRETDTIHDTRWEGRLSWRF